MKTTMRPDKEVVVTVPDKIGTISKISTVLAEARVDIRAICAYSTDNQAHIRIIANDSAMAMQALAKAGFSPQESLVVVSEVSPHSIHPEITGAAGGYEIENNYWCASSRCGEHAVLVFSSKDNVTQITSR